MARAWVDLDDKDLLDRWSHDPSGEGARALIQRHYPWTLNLFYRLTGNRGHAEELTQDLFMRLTEQVASGRSIAHLRAWLHATAMNLWRDWARRMITARTKGISHSGGDAEISSTLGQEPSAHDYMEGRMVREAVLALSPKHREVIALCHFQGLTCEEAARALDLSAGTVRSRLHYALTALREKLVPAKCEVIL